MKKIIYAAYHKNTDVVNSSSSGGIFTVLTDAVLEDDGVVIAGCYDYNAHSMKHTICKTKIERDKCRGSKYIQSVMDVKVYETIENTLKSDQKLFFIGMPCQVAAIKSYVKLKNLDDTRLYTCDILCHGVGSSGIWYKFIKYLENKKKTKITFLTFKDKKKGWKNPRCVAYSGNGKEYSIRNYSWMYFSNSIMRPSCYECKFTSLDRQGDITIGDFWKVKQKVPDMYNQMGTSFMIINTLQGEKLFKETVDNLEFQECAIEDVIQNNMKSPTRRGIYREKIFRDYKFLSPELFFLKWKITLLLSKVFKKKV